jgi:3-oxoacyl-[acyl-carrier-protein] synthase II
LGLNKIHALAGSKNGLPELMCPFDQRHNGIIAGEAAAVVVLEDLEHALARKAEIYAEIAGYGKCFDSSQKIQYNLEGRGMLEAMARAIGMAGLSRKDINHILANANSNLDADVAEANAIRELSNGASAFPVSAVKSATGEAFAASGLLEIIAGIGSIQKQVAFPILNHLSLDERCKGLNLVLKPESIAIKNILVNAFDASGFNSSVIISHYK